MSTLRAFVTNEAPPPAAPMVAGRVPPPRTPMFPSGLVVDLRPKAGGELAPSAAGGDLRYAQLGAGRCRRRTLGAHTASLQIWVEEWSLGVLKTGRVPQGAVTFLIPVSRGGLARVQGRAVASGEVMVLFDGDELDYRSDGPARLVTVSVERAALESRLRSVLGLRVGELRLRGLLAGLRVDEVALLRVCRDAAARPALLRDPVLAAGLERHLVELLFAGFEAPRAAEPPSRGRALARRAEAWLRQNLAEPPTIADLCGAVRASERTLHEAFREHLGTTPKAYLKTLRLNAARNDLLRAGARTRVTDVALDWGFLHFGWFSQDYRRQFGETPSQTLHRGRADAARRSAAGAGGRNGASGPGEPAAVYAS